MFSQPVLTQLAPSETLFNDIHSFTQFTPWKPTKSSLRYKSSTPPTLDHCLQRVRHQLSTPIALIQMYVDLFTQVTLEQQQQEWLSHLQQVTQELSSSLTRLTQAPSSSTTDTVFPEHDLLQVLQDCLQMFAPLLAAKSLQVLYDGTPLRLKVDGWKIKQVFQNILNNAIMFSPNGGVIAIRSQITPQEILLTITDQGQGLSEQDLQSLGQPFYSRRVGGTGLGIATAIAMLAEHRGEMWAENAPQGGAQFWISLPRC
jgi:signal transduction histidine kinase